MAARIEDSSDRFHPLESMVLKSRSLRPPRSFREAADKNNRLSAHAEIFGERNFFGPCTLVDSSIQALIGASSSCADSIKSGDKPAPGGLTLWQSCRPLVAKVAV